MTLLQFIMAARADFMAHREPESVDRRTDMACLVAVCASVLIALAMAGGA